MRRWGSGWRRAVMASVAAAVLVIGVVPAQADASDEARLLSLTNQLRSSKGLAPLSIDAHLTSVAQSWAATLAGRGVLSHNSSLPGQVTGWKELGENVGVGGTVDAVHAGFLASPTHQVNLVDGGFTRVGFGIVRPDARIFVVEVFMRPSSSPAAPAAGVAPAPAPAATSPATSPRPATAPPPATPHPVVTELSPWMVNSLDQLRSMEPLNRT